MTSQITSIRSGHGYYDMSSFIVFICILPLLLIFCRLPTGNSGQVQCYQCNSGTGFEGPNCASSATTDLASYIFPCPNDYTMMINYTHCRKIVQTVESDTRVIRTCAATGSGTPGSSTCIDRKGTAYVDITYCDCATQGDGLPCNGASYATSSRFVTSLAAVVGIALWTWLGTLKN